MVTSASGPNRAQIFAFLEQIPALAGLPSEVLVGLAGRLQPRRYLRGQLFYDDRHPLAERQLRFVYGGVCTLFRAYGLQMSYRMMKRPFDWFGTEGLWDWSGQPMSPVFAAESPGEGYSARAYDTSWCLELPRGYFSQVFQGVGGGLLLDALLNGGRHDSTMPMLQEAVRGAAFLGELRADHIEALLRAGTWTRYEPGEAVAGLAAGDTPDFALVLAAGQMRPDGGSGALHGRAVGLSELLLGRPLEQGFRAAEGSHAIKLSRQAIQRVVAQRPTLERSLGRMLEGASLPSHAAVPKFTLSVVLDGTHRTLPTAELGAMAIRLGRAVARELQGGVTVAQVRPTHQTVLEPDRSVGRLHIEQVRQSDLAAYIQGGGRSTDDIAAMIVDPSGLGPATTSSNTQIDHTLASLKRRYTVSWLLADPATAPDICLKFPPRFRRRFLPTALLDPRPPTTGVGVAFEQGRRKPGAGSGSHSGGGSSAGVLRGLVRAVKSRVRVRAERLATGEVRFDNGWSPEGEPAPIWPSRTVRIRVTPAERTKLVADGEDALDLAAESFERWARALTYRLVGVSVGGAGALSYVGLPMIRGLRESNIPIDCLAGTSFGSAVGAYYAGAGDEGLSMLLRSWPAIYTVLALSFITSRPMEKLVDCEVGVLDLDQLDIPFFPVATDAYTMHEWDVRGGLLGNAVRCASSMPPCAPTYRGQNRLLDGGCSADVPCQVLVEDGANLVIAVNPWNYPLPLPPPFFWIPGLSTICNSLDPSARMRDSYRSYMNLWRASAYSQATWADLVYSATTVLGNSGTFFLGRTIARQAVESEALQQCLFEARLMYGPSDAALDPLEDGYGVEVPLIGRKGHQRAQLDAKATRTLVHIAEAMLKDSSTTAWLVTGYAPAAGAESKGAHGKQVADTVAKALAGFGVPQDMLHAAGSNGGSFGFGKALIQPAFASSPRP